MKLWLVSRTDRVGYDEYDSMVVAAETEEEARKIHPSDHLSNMGVFYDNGWKWVIGGVLREYSGDSWANPDQLTVEYLGTTDREIKGVIISSFNAG